MTTPIKALFATLATGAMAVAAAVPASAHDGDFGHRGGYDRGHGHGWNGGNSRNAIEMCSRVAERQASRVTSGNARVTDIRDVRDTRGGFEVRGRIAVNARDHGGYDRGGYDRGGYDRGWNDRGGGNHWGNNDWRHDSGSFTCRVERGRVASLDFNGIRGL